MDTASTSVAAPRGIGVLGAALVWLGVTGAALAQPAPAPEAGTGAETEAGTDVETEAGTGAARPAVPADRPWAAGVPPAQQQKAQELYDAGNLLLRDFLLAEAVDQYRAALGYWNHPSIHYNLARALYYLGRPLEAHESILEALRHGPAPLQQREHTQALAFKERIEKQLAWLEVSCDEPGMDILLDGRPLLTGPGLAHRPLLPGEHLLVASRAGAQPASQRLRLQAGRQTRIELWSRQRWQPWEPWTVLGTGATVGITGALLQWRAGVHMDRFRREFARQCPAGCLDSQVPVLSALRSHGTWQNRIGVGAMIVGGAGTLTGAVMVAMNRSQSIRIRLDGSPGAHDGPSIAPALSAGSLGAVATFSF